MSIESIVPKPLIVTDVSSPNQPESAKRRKLVQTAGAASLMSLVPPLVRQSAWAQGSDAPEKKEAKIGFTVATSQEIWTDHPEKVLGTTDEFTKKYPNTARAMVAAILEASRFIDQETDKKKTATILADKSYVNAPVEVIEDRWEGKYDNGNGKKWTDANAMKFRKDGAVNFPYLSDGMWFLTQHKRWGLLKEHPDYLGVAKSINKIDIYKKAAAAAKVAIPKSEMRSSKLSDGVVWDGSNP